MKNRKSLAYSIELPKNVLALQPLLEEYNREKKRSETQWHILCVEMPSYERWRAQQLFGKGKLDLTFSGLAARAYTDLFELSYDDLPKFKPSSVRKISALAGTLIDSLPVTSLLPADAQETVFLSGLNSLSRWKPSELQAGVSSRGDPLRRWLIRKLTEEFCYGTATYPTVPLVGDLIRLGWPEVEDRSIRNTLTKEVFDESMQVANVRRERMNQSTTIAHQIMAKASSQKFNISDFDTKNSINQMPSGFEILVEMTRLASSIPEDDIRNRALSFMQALRDEASYPQEDTGEGS